MLPETMSALMASTGPRNPTPGVLPADTDVLIVGAGIMGLAIAYHLVENGVRHVVVLDRGYLAGGASGRNGGGVRAQWSSPLNIDLMRESLSLCSRFAQDLGVNVWLRRGGYLFLAKDAAEVSQLEANATLQQRHGLRTRLLLPDEARALVPELDVHGVQLASFNPDDGVLFPWPFLWGYADRATRFGVTIHPHTDVRRIDRLSGTSRDSARFLIETSRGTLRARRLVCAAGAWSPEVARLAGVSLPTAPHRHEILSTEPLKPFLDPMVSVLASGLYFSQSMRGEIVAGVTVKDSDGSSENRFATDETVELGSRLRFLTTLSRELLAVMPRLAPVKVLRQWAGPYDISPDSNPIVGEHPDLPGFYLCSGFMGHGFMMAPVVGKHYGAWLAGGPEPPFLHPWRLSRFAEGKPLHQELIIG